MGRVVLQYSHYTCDTALGWARSRCAGSWARERWATRRKPARGRGAAGAWQGRTARAAWALGARPGRWARGLGVRAGQGCALGALSLFSTRFDSVFFLSQIFGHCS